MKPAQAMRLARRHANIKQERRRKRWIGRVEELKAEGRDVNIVPGDGGIVTFSLPEPQPGINFRLLNSTGETICISGAVPVPSLPPRSLWQRFKDWLLHAFENKWSG